MAGALPTNAAGPPAESPTPRPSAWWVFRPAGVAVVLALVLYAGFRELAEDFRISPKIIAFDAKVTAVVLTWRGVVLTPVFKVLTSLANPASVWFLAAVIVLVFLLRRMWAEAVLVVVTVGGGVLLGSLAKHANGRPRPPVANMLIPLPSGYSFPSGHALVAILLYGVLAFLAFLAVREAWERFAVVATAAVVIVLVGLSRVYLGVHWPSDVVAAWLLGGAWLVLCCGAYLSWGRWQAKAADGPRGSAT